MLFGAPLAESLRCMVMISQVPSIIKFFHRKISRCKTHGFHFCMRNRLSGLFSRWVQINWQLLSITIDGSPNIPVLHAESPQRLVFACVGSSSQSVRFLKEFFERNQSSKRMLKEHTFKVPGSMILNTGFFSRKSQNKPLRRFRMQNWNVRRIINCYREKLPIDLLPP